MNRLLAILGLLVSLSAIGWSATLGEILPTANREYLEVVFDENVTPPAASAVHIKSSGTPIAIGSVEAPFGSLQQLRLYY
ncbi:MAG: hypothetical protein O3A53_20235, partial [Acidobacteria bacterium]|nr:hypothetical protein [Acidobacteriota bacterium]